MKGHGTMIGRMYASHPVKGSVFIYECPSTMSQDIRVFRTSVLSLIVLSVKALRRSRADLDCWKMTRS